MIIPRRIVDAAPGEFSSLINPWSAKNQRQSAPEAIAAWERQFAEFTGRQSAITVGSGRFAMKLILMALDLPTDSEVIIPAYTLKDLLPIIRSVNLVPVPADIDPLHWNLTADSIRERITTKTRAVLVLHLFGNPCPLPEIMNLAKEHNLKVIEDCAHSAGSTINNTPTGAFGEAAFFSFESIKPINTYGGGMVVTDNQDLATRIRQAVSSLVPPVNLTKKVGAALFERIMFTSGLARLPLALLASDSGQQLMTRLYRLLQPAPSQPHGYSPLQAELGMQRLATLATRIAIREKQAGLLRKFLPAAFTPQQAIKGGRANNYFFVVKAPGSVDKIRRKLLRSGLDAGIGAEIADDCAALLGENCPNAAALFAHGLHLPLHERMNENDIMRLAAILGKIA